MTLQKDETPKLAARGFQEHLASVAAFDVNHGAYRDTNITFAQAAGTVVDGGQVSGPCTVTLLTATGALRMAKLWRSDGTTDDYGLAKNFRHRVARVRNIRELSTLLSAIEADPQTCIIRGGFIGHDLALPLMQPEEGWLPDHVLRRETVFKDRGQHALMVDVDKYKPTTGDPVNDPVQCIDEFIGQHLPDCFAGISYHWQLSNSAGLAKHRGVLKAHLWFWSETPYTSASLKAWAISAAPAIDSAVFNAIQAHYTAAPVLADGVADPVPVRSGFVSGWMGDAVPLTIAQAVAPKRAAPDFLTDDPVSRRLHELGSVRSVGREGRLYINCPREGSHTGGTTGPTSCIYFPAHTNGYSQGHFKCMHESCNGISDRMFRDLLGIDPADACEGFVDAVGAVNEPAVQSQNLVDDLRKQPRDAVLSTWAQRTAALPKDAAAVVLDEVVRLTGLGRRILASALNDARRELKREQRRKDLEQRVAKRVMMIYRPEDSVAQSRTIGTLILKGEPPESMLTFGGYISQIVDAPMAQAHRFDNEEADAPITLHVRPHTQASMRALVEMHVMMSIETEQGRKAVAVPSLTLDALLELESADAPSLTGLLTHPTALSDGTILSANGLHRRTGLFLSGVTGDSYRPYTQGEATAALSRIRAVMLEGFEFASELDSTVAIAGLFTGVQRRLLDMAPGLALLAAAQSSGKTTYLRVIHIILTGRDLPVTTLPIGNEAEIEKRLLSLLMQSPAMIAFDNIPDGFTVHSGSLSAAMTSATFEGRVLGVSRMATVPTNVLIALSGNNLTFGADEISRWLVARLAPQQARPEERRFRHADVVAHALAHRESVLRDVVGIVSGFISSGSTMNLSGTRFPKWDRMVRQPLIWAGAEDVARVFRINETESEHAQALRGLLLALHAVFGDRLFYAREVADATQQLGMGAASPLPGRLRDALEALGVKDVHRPRSVTRVLSAKSERTVTINDDTGKTLRLCRRVDRDSTAGYRLLASP